VTAYPVLKWLEKPNTTSAPIRSALRKIREFQTDNTPTIQPVSARLNRLSSEEPDSGQPFSALRQISGIFVLRPSPNRTDTSEKTNRLRLLFLLSERNTASCSMNVPPHLIIGLGFLPVPWGPMRISSCAASRAGAGAVDPNHRLSNQWVGS
jgi:hypothetical protein